MYKQIKYFKVVFQIHELQLQKPRIVNVLHDNLYSSIN